MLALSLKEQPRLRLAAPTLIVIVMIADEDIVDRQGGREHFMYALDGGASLRAPGNIGLICNNEESESVRFQVEQRRCNLRQNFEFFEAGGREWFAVPHESAVDNPVAVEENCRAELARSSRLPLGLFLLHRRVRHQQMPHYGLECFRVRRNVSRVDRWNNDADIRNFGGVAAIASNDPQNFRANSFRILQGGYQVGADIFFEIAAADRKDEHQIIGTQAADPKPGFEHTCPTFIIGSRCKL